MKRRSITLQNAILLIKLLYDNNPYRILDLKTPLKSGIFNVL